MLDPEQSQKRRDFLQGMSLGLLYLFGSFICLYIIFLYVLTANNSSSGLPLIILLWFVNFILILRQLRKQKTREFIKGFLIVVLLVPLIFLAACFGILLVIF